MRRPLRQVRARRDGLEPPGDSITGALEDGELPFHPSNAEALLVASSAFASGNGPACSISQSTAACALAPAPKNARGSARKSSSQLAM
jgi:hypothetical protein